MLAKASGMPSAWPMVTREARSASGERSGPPRSMILRAAVERRPVELVRPFLRPAQPAFFAEDLDVEAVHAPDRHRTRPQAQRRAAVHAKIDHRVVFERAAGHAGDEVGGEFARLLAADVARHVQSVNAAICELRRGAGLCGIVAPAHARIVRVGSVGVEAMREFGLDEPHLSEIAARDHRPHVAHQRIAGIAVVDGEERRRRASRRAARSSRFVERHRHRLFAQHARCPLRRNALAIS